MISAKKLFLKLIGPLIGVILFVGTLYLLLFSFDKQESKKITQATLGRDKKITIHSDSFLFSKYRIFGAAPNSKVSFRLTYDGKEIYDQVYQSNEVLMRIPLAEAQKKEKHIIFGGCSFTWGEGMKPHETFAWIVQHHFKNVNAYNIGFPGGGLNLQLKYHELFDYRKVVQEETGYFVYTFFPDQLNRFYARYSFLSWADENYPHYEIVKGRPVDKGAIKDQAIYKKFMMFRKSGIEKSAIKTQNSDEWSDQELNDFALSIKELSRLYNEKFPLGELIFIIHPKDKFSNRNRLTEFLTRLKIKVLEPITEFDLYLKSQNKGITQMQIPFDGHPNQEFNRFFGNWLAKELRKVDQNLK